MLNYEIERKLSDKADKYELQSVQSENRQLKNDVSELERQVNELKSINSNRYSTLEGLFTILAEHPQFSDISNQLYELRQTL